MKKFKNNQILNAAALPVFAIAVFILTALTVQNLQAQTVYSIAPGSQITVAGTSNLHDWTMVATKFSCDAKLTMVKQKLKVINSLLFVLPVKNLKSKETLMDNRAYKTLNEQGFDKMTFKLTDATVIDAQKIAKVTGNLTISGVTKVITLQANYALSDDDVVTFKSTKAIKMSDFKVKAPSFMMGALKTGNDLTINIVLKLKK